MCDPLTIGGIVLTGASAAASNAAQSQVSRARDDAMAAERIRQGELDREAAAHNVVAQDQYQDFSGKQGDRAKTLADFFTAQEAAPIDKSGPAALPASGSNITVQAEDKARGEAKAFTDKTGTALGKLRSFGDLMGELGRGTAREAGYIGQIGGFKKGSSAVLPYELEAANSKGGGMKMLGDILGGLGKIGIGAGLSGSSLFGGAASNPVSSFGAGATRAAGGAFDRLSVPGYSAQTNPFSVFGR